MVKLIACLIGVCIIKMQKSAVNELLLSLVGQNLVEIVRGIFDR
jgi:hypothetical protein